MKSSRKDFVAESGDLLEEGGRLLLEIQETSSAGVNPDTINALFRTFHTIKGICGLFGFKDIADFSHALESLLDDIRLGRIEISDDVVAFLFSNIDILKRTVEDIANDREYSVSDGQKELASFLESRKGGQESQKAADPFKSMDTSILKALSEYEEHRLKTNVKEGKGIYLAKTVFSLTDFDKGLTELTKLIKSQGELLATLPTSTDLPPDVIGFNLLFGSIKTPEDLRKLLNLEIEIMKPGEVKPAPLQAPAAPQPPAPKAQDGSLKSSTTSVRVDIEKLDRILNTISELSLAKAATDRIAAEMAVAYGQTGLVIDILKITQTLRKKIAELQEQVLEIRMVPIGQIFSRLSQVVRRYSRETGKQIELLFYGEETEIDKFLAEEIVDPLMHTVRNAMDHGIEPPEERRKAGKKEAGTITLKAFQRGHHVVVEVKDDGAGINTEAVEKKAREKGLVPDGVKLEEKDILDFIFLPGFSTKTTVSEVSGRGVGMDVVRSKLLPFGGFVDLSTERGKGTTFMLTMPITLAIVKALFVRVGTERFAVPLTSLSETLVIEEKDLQTIEGREVYNLRGEMLPIVSIAKIFGLESDSVERFFTVVIRYGDKSLGFLVDELIGQNEIVIKSLGNYFTKVRGFAGATEIRKHQVILVLDMESIVEESVPKQRGVVHV
ncbi:MAG TPA: chemotaxis protein CheA [Thermodesulfovibrionales bacterium]|jgi:two-component system chemotaxis sensor kinase CheA|nr:chemotaxis protein CheA [Thermodesulfovibrionales bacterium]